MAERTALVDAVAVRAVLGNAHAAGVEEPQARVRGAFLVDLDVRVTVDERGAPGQRGRVVDAVVHAGAKDMAVRQEQLAAGFVEQRGVVGHDGIVEDHLVDLGIAVAAHRDDAVGQGVEQRDYALGGVIARQVVARTVVEQVAQQDDAVGLLGLDGGDQALGPICRAVDVGGDEVFHGGSFRDGVNAAGHVMSPATLFKSQCRALGRLHHALERHVVLAGKASAALVLWRRALAAVGQGGHFNGHLAPWRRCALKAAW